MKYFLLLVFTLFFISCGSDDDNNSPCNTQDVKSCEETYKNCNYNCTDIGYTNIDDLNNCTDNCHCSRLHCLAGIGCERNDSAIENYCG